MNLFDFETDSYKVKVDLCMDNLELEDIPKAKAKHFNIPNFDIDYPFHISYQKNRNVVEKIFKEFIKVAKDDITKSSEIYLVFRGSSGCFFAAIFYELLTSKKFVKGVKMLYIRKQSENSHFGGSNYEFLGKSDNLWIWVDDFISSGDTLVECHDSLDKGDDWKFDWVVCNHSYRSGFDFAKELAKNIVCNYDL
jgi:hypothetical protein